MRIPVRGKAKNLIKMKIILSQKTLQIGTDHIIKVSEMHVAPQIFSSTFNNIHPSASTCIHFRPAASTRIHFRSWPIIFFLNSFTCVHLRPPTSKCSTLFFLCCNILWEWKWEGAFCRCGSKLNNSGWLSRR